MKASILTANFNCSPYLKDYIISIARQTYTNWELIFVDDKSKDDSVKVMRRFAKQDSRIRIIVNDTRLKCGGAYNVALQNATGDICCVIDADDVLASTKALGQLVNKYIQYPDVDYIWTQFYFCDPQLRRIKKGSCRLPIKSFLQAGLDYSKDRHCFSHWRTFRTHLRDKGLIFNPALPAAVDKWMGYTLEEIGKGGFYDKVLYLYRQRIGGLSYRGRKHWKRILVHFSKRREECNIKPIRQVKIK